MKCKVKGCKKTVTAKGYCPSHYQSWYRHKDDPNWTPEPLRGPSGQLGDEPLVQCPVWVPPQVADVIRIHREDARKALCRLAERLLQKGVMRDPGRK